MPTLSRRQLLVRIGAAGGASAIYQAAKALGITAPVPLLAVPTIQPLGARRASVAILGAGIGGLTAAYELSRAGYDCTILEATHRAGGRNMTLRHGDVVDELGARQLCRFDDEPHLYFNAGAARIPGNHTAVLHYCRELNVPLEVFVNENRNAWIQDDGAFGGKRIRISRYEADAKGFLGELAAKGAGNIELDVALSADDRERLIAAARTFGALGPDGRYHGSGRAGYAAGGFVAPAVPLEPLEIQQLLKSSFWFGNMYFFESADQAATMLQPVGGMDRIVSAFMSKVGSFVHTNAVVTRITLRGGGVDVHYRVEGKSQQLQADYCIDCIPSHLLAGLEHNFPAEYSEALAAIPRGTLLKMGMQAKRRFWEEDDHIYGGMSFTNQDVSQIWYPPHGLHQRKGIVQAGYSFNSAPLQRFTRMTPEQRIATAMQQADKVHPGFADEIENGVSVAWHRMNYMLGCNAAWSAELFRKYFVRLQQPAGRHYLVGDQVSYHSGWQEGAIRSAHFAIEHIDGQMRASVEAGA